MKIESKDSVSGVRTFVFFIAVVVVLGFFQYFNRAKINREGVYTKCKIINSEGYKGGILITIEYSFDTKRHVGRLSSDLGRGAIGNQYFIKILPNKEDGFVFLRDHPVPECLLNTPPPPNGWKEIPSCK